MEKKFVNLIGHEINELITGLTLEGSKDRIARVESLQIEVGEINGIPIFELAYGKLRGLPEPVKGIIYVVSAMALNGVPSHRTDVVAPAKVQRDRVTHKTIGCMGFRTK